MVSLGMRAGASLWATLSVMSSALRADAASETDPRTTTAAVTPQLSDATSVDATSAETTSAGLAASAVVMNRLVFRTLADSGLGSCRVSRAYFRYSCPAPRRYVPVNHPPHTTDRVAFDQKVLACLLMT